MTYTFSTGSGFLNSPPRVVLIGDDNRPGSYPVEVSPVLAAKSTEYAKPYRDNIFPDTRSPYAQASVVFTAVPNEGESITLTNAQSQAHTFTFKLTSPNFATGPTSYDISYTAGDGLSATPREGDEGLTRSQVITKRALEKFVQAVNAATGSLITASPTSYYNRAILTQRIPGTAGNTANSTTSADVTIQSFTGGNAGEIRYPFGIIASGSGEVLRRVLSMAESGTLDVPAAGKASLLNAYSDGHPYAVFQPYDESNAQQAFGIGTGGSEEYGTQTQLYDEFFTRGSTLGPLDEPLDAKDKIVIDLMPVEQTELQFVNKAGGTWPAVAENYPMAYFNHTSKKWERIGLGVDPNNFVYSTVSTENQLKSHMVGFSQNYLSTASNLPVGDIRIIDSADGKIADGTKRIFSETSWASCIDTFGFPSHAHFHATSSQQLQVSSLIEKPFVIEKIAYEFSASCDTTVNFANGQLKSGGATFFILNQRKAGPERLTQSTAVNISQLNTSPGTKEYLPSPSSTGSSDSLVFSLTSAIPESVFLTREDYSTSKLTYVDTVRDLVTFSRIGAISSSYNSEISNTFYDWVPHPAVFMDLAISVADGGTYNGYFTIADTVKSPTFNAGLGSTALYTAAGQRVLYVYVSKTSITRNSYSIPTGRSYRSEQAASRIIFETKAINDSAPRTITNSRIYGIENDALNSPYVLHPGDNLVFGWQSSFPQRIIADAIGEKFSIGPGAGKLTLYGSYLQDDKPVHDIYKDQLNSDAAHEALPAGPWVLDRFETEPQMCYSGSMREEHVTGTMVTRNATGGLTVTNVNDFSIGEVRSVSARVSDGNVRQRWSFFRNNRLLDSEEQYYDSMQPNPLEAFRITDPNYGLVGARNTTVSPEISVRFLVFMIPGETYVDGPYPDINGFFNDVAIKNWFGTFTFEGDFKNLVRNKSLNSRVFSSTLLTGSDFFSVGSANSYPTTATEIYFLSGSSGSTINDLGPLPHSNMSAPGGLFRAGYNGASRSFLTNELIDTNPIPDALGIIYGGKGTSAIRDEVTQKDVLGRFVNFHASRFAGCFGDGYLQIIQFQNDYRLDPLDPQDFCSGMIYRGTKHGLINPTPLFSNAIFNGTRYGQFRDMMEQRQYTRFSLSDNTLTDAAVSVQFINRAAPPGTLNITSGSATNSSNISKFATSEHPYDDALSSAGQIWDRDTALPETFIAL